MRLFIIAGLVLYLGDILWMGINKTAGIDYPLHIDIIGPPLIAGTGILAGLYGILFRSQ